MAQSQLNLYNMALSAVGADYTLSATNESTVPAAVCELWYENARQTLLRAAHFNFAKQFVRLTEEAERDTAADWVTTDPEPGFAFSYEIPSNMLAARYLTDYSRFDLSFEASDQMILSCDVGGSAATDAPVLCYTIDVTDMTRFDASTYQALVYALAGHICRPLHGKTSVARDMYALANEIILQARAQTANERQQYFHQKPEVLSLRGHVDTITAPYIQPYGALFAAAGAPVV